MKSRREGWLRVGCRLGALMVALGPPSAATARAQGAPGGFGPDPFQPYTRQYAPYSRPMGPAGPAGGMGGAPIFRQGFVGANQFDQYLQGLSGPGRDTTDRAGIGMPYYRSSVDPAWGTGRNRVYRPNSESAPAVEETRRKAATRYFAYFSERDPKKRVALLRDYRQARRQAERVLSSDEVFTPSRSFNEDRPAAGRRARDDRARRGTSRSAVHPAPPVPFGHRSSSGARSSRRRAPSDTLRRAHEMDEDTFGTPPSRRSSTPRD